MNKKLFFPTIFSIILLISLFKSYSFYAQTKSNIILDKGISKSLSNLKIKKQFQVSSSKRKYNHSPSIVHLGQNKLMAVWYAGDYEGGINMELYIKYFDGKKWHNEQSIIKSSSLDYKTRRIGNAIIFNHPSYPKQISILFTSTLGGWATSYLNIIHSYNEGKSWSTPERLYLGNILNFSHLVRNKPSFYENGNVLLPIYHEFANKFGVAVILSPEGKVLSYKQLSKSRNAIQPTISFTGKNQGVIFYRNSSINKYGRKTWVSTFKDNFEDISPLNLTNIININTSVATINNNNELLIAYTSSNKTKSNMSLGIISKNLSEVKPLFSLYKNECKYPYIVKGEGVFHIVYSIEHGQAIKHAILHF